MSHSQFRWHGFGDAEQLALAAASKIQKRAVEAIDQRGAFHLVLAGGTTPRRIYSLLAAAGCDWPCWQVYFGDERCLPPGDAGRNDTMAREHWLNAVNMQADQIHTIPAERGARSGARDYAERLQGVACFDLVLLGLGEDGHTASLFPGRPAGAEAGAADALAVFDAPKPPPQRVSMSAARLSHTRALLLLVSGAGKRAAMAELLAGAATPVTALQPPGGIDVLLDKAAAPPGIQTETTIF